VDEDSRKSAVQAHGHMMCMDCADEDVTSNRDRESACRFKNFRLANVSREKNHHHARGPCCFLNPALDVEEEDVKV
jgi:hypothetical protein